MDAPIRPLPDIARIEDLFRRLSLDISAAECHGMLCGMLCASDTVSSAAWMAELLETEFQSGTSLVAASIPIEDDGQRLLTTLFAYTVEQLEDPDYRFALLLPEDEHSLIERTEALSTWCQGFLRGLGLGGLQDQGGLSRDSREMVQDLIEISKLDHSNGGGEEEESAYAEIVEYLRVAVLLIYEEFRPLRAAHPKNGKLH